MPTFLVNTILVFAIVNLSVAAPAAQPQIPNAVASTAGTALWTPPVNVSWQIILSQPLNIPSSASSITPDVDVFSLDLFGNTASTIQTLHQLNKKVICYFSAGSYEPGRPDSANFLPSDLGSQMANWPDEKWLDIRSLNVQKIMAARIQLAKSKGCDAVDPDNVDGYNNVNGLGLTQQDTVNFMTSLASQAHTSGLSIGLKNAIEVLPALQNTVQFAVNEACTQYSECGAYTSMTKTGKGVLSIAYPAAGVGNVKPATLSKLCANADAAGLSMIIKNPALGPKVEFCDGSVATTPV
ncbi:hypothetical protein HII31_07502 [Pseudocercospora fuligena]|uniref:alpha-galactosidase n=1 Tax=Pseudocercospora fuligena TaxID=685502 RepID=A0A8H6VHX2_9PEZI|nr:hypothetical protein HII31_07502 [Pseudocercospora fuligena]